MKKSPKSPKKQSAKITKLKMRVGEITSMLLQNNPKMVKMLKGGSSGYADLFMSKQLMKGGKMDGDTEGKIVEFLNDVKNIKAVKELKISIFNKLEGELKILISTALYNPENYLYDYNLCNFIDIEKVKEELKEELKKVLEDLITLDIINKFYKLVENNVNLNKSIFINENPPDIEGAKAAAPAAKEVKEAERVEAVIKLSNAWISHKARNIVRQLKGEKDNAINLLITEMDDLWENIRSNYEEIFITNILNVLVINQNNIITFKTDITDKDITDKKQELLNLNTYHNLFIDLHKIFLKYNDLNDEGKAFLRKDIFTAFTVNEIEADIDIFKDFNIPDIKGKIYDIYNIIDPNSGEARAARAARDDEEGGAAGDRGDVVQPGPGGKLPAKYKSLGIAVHILYKKRKYKRTIYVKDKKKTKYCKIDGEYILLSKMKVIA